MLLRFPVLLAEDAELEKLFSPALKNYFNVYDDYFTNFESWL